MTTFLLIRHGLHELGGDRIAGRMPGVHLSEAGRAQAERLVGRLDGVRIDALLCSPMERTVETATPLSEARGLELRRCEQLLEIDYGEWTGARLDDLDGDPRWRAWNEYRSGHRVPGGESMVEVQARAVSLLRDLAGERPDGVIALVSHGDVIKSAVAHLLGAPLDLFLRIEISTASITAVAVGELGPWVLCVNNTAELAQLPLPSPS